MKKLLKSAAAGGLVLLISACTAPEDPQGTVCGQMAETLTSRSSISWEAPSKKDHDGILQVDMFSADLNASCYFYRQTDDTNGGEIRHDKLPWETVPFKMTINGNPVAEQDMVKASFTATGRQFETSVRETDRMLQEKALEAQKAAEKAAHDVMQKAKDLNY